MGNFIDRNVKWLFPLPAILFILVMMVFPILYTVWNSMTPWSISAGRPATFFGLTNYFNLPEDTRFVASISRTLFFTILAVVIEVVLGVAIALLLNRDFPLKRFINSIILLPMMATPVAIAMVWLLMYVPTSGIVNFVLRSLGLPEGLWVYSANTVIPALALVDIWEWTPMIILICLAGLTALPHDPFEAARVDGASSWQTIRYITLPMLMPTITIAMLLRLIDALKTFDIIYTMTGGGPGFTSETLNIYAFVQAFQYFNFGYASSVLVIFFAIVLGVSLLVTYTRRTLEV
ncbi:MAG: sugar ABC transporter permease [Chloroflexi bacterium]|nr:sugar ABC transporter permease [Chloroflexota bacterium]